MERVRSVFLSGMEVLFWLTLLAASIRDFRFHCVERIVWWISGIAGFGVLLLRNVSVTQFAMSNFAEWVCYVILQFCFLGRFYGKADCYAFSGCGIMILAFGGGMKSYLIHMLIAFSFLGLIQLGRKNINEMGNLKDPVPFIPYIAAALCFFFILRYLGVAV